MKKLLLVLLFMASSCTTTRVSMDDTDTDNNKQILAKHSIPVKIYGIGRFKPNSVIITLVDSNNEYFTIETPADNTLKVGDVYSK